MNVFPASHFVTPADKLRAAIGTIEAEAEERVAWLEEQGRALEAARLRQRTTFDLEMIRELGFCSGIENYSRHLSGAGTGIAPVDAARLLPAGLAPRRRRVAHDDPPGRGDVQERPDPQGDPRRLRVPAAVGARQPAPDVRGVRGDRQPGGLHERHARALRAGAKPADRRAADPAHRNRGPGHHSPPDRGPDRRPHGAHPRAGGARRAGPRHDAHQADGRGPRRLPARARRQGPVPPQRGRHPRAGPDPARPPARRLRRPRRDQPPPRGDRPARGHPRRDPRRRQGGLPAQRLVADPDDRPGGPRTGGIAFRSAPVTPPCAASAQCPPLVSAMVPHWGGG